MAREQLKTLTEAMYYVLLSLIKQNHGYGVMKMISDFTEGRVTVGAGTLYALLGRFEKEEIISQVAEENRRKIYKLTDKGQDILQEEFARLNKMVSDGQNFFKYDGQTPTPPEDNTGGDFFIPATEQTCDKQQQISNENEDAQQVGENDSQKPIKETKGFGIGGFGKGVVIPT